MPQSSNFPENRNKRSVSDPSYIQKRNLLHILIFSLRSGRYLLPYVFDIESNAFPQLTFQCWNLCYIKLRDRKAQLRIPPNFGQKREGEKKELWHKSLKSENTYRTHTEHIQNIYRTHTEQIQNIYRTYTEHIQNTYRTYTEHIQNTYRTYTEHIQNTYKTYTEQIQNTYRTHTEHIQNTYRTYTEQIQNTYRTYTEHLWNTYRTHTEHI
jgi:hypothetical protein